MNQSTSRVFWFGLLNKLIATKALNVNVERRIPFFSSFYVIENITHVSASIEKPVYKLDPWLACRTLDFGRIIITLMDEWLIA